MDGLSPALFAFKEAQAAPLKQSTPQVLHCKLRGPPTHCNTTQDPFPFKPLWLWELCYPCNQCCSRAWSLNDVMGRPETRTMSRLAGSFCTESTRPMAVRRIPRSLWSIRRRKRSSRVLSARLTAHHQWQAAKRATASKHSSDSEREASLSREHCPAFRNAETPGSGAFFPTKHLGRSSSRRQDQFLRSCASGSPVWPQRPNRPSTERGPPAGLAPGLPGTCS